MIYAYLYVFIIFGNGIEKFFEMYMKLIKKYVIFLIYDIYVKLRIKFCFYKVNFVLLLKLVVFLNCKRLWIIEMSILKCFFY